MKVVAATEFIQKLNSTPMQGDLTPSSATPYLNFHSFCNPKNVVLPGTKRRRTRHKKLSKSKLSYKKTLNNHLSRNKYKMRGG